MTNEEAIQRLKEGAPFSALWNEQWEEALNMAIEALHERKTGKWKKILLATVPFTLYGYDCPFCEFRTAIDSFNFCPNCGAKMEVDE